MSKLIHLSLLSFLITCCAFTQQVKTVPANSYSGILLTKIVETKSTDGKERDTSKILYVMNQAVDSFFVYQVSGNVLAEARAYTLVTGKSMYLRSRSIMGGQEAAEDISIKFNDADYSLMLKGQDHYTLYPAFYASLKQQVIGKHSLLGLFVVLIDNIGDYSLSNIYPQFLSSGSGRLGKSIQKAKIVTQRSQAAVRDTWICKYYYNKRNKLDSLTAASKEEVRFRKKVNYTQASSITIASYRNIEDRQITSRKETYPLTGAWLKLAGQIEETGKNLDTELSATLTKKNLGQIKSLKMSQAEVLKLIR